MISASNRKLAVDLINTAINSGARLFKACDELGISKRTFNRWNKQDNCFVDKRTVCERPEPKNKLTKEEKQKILKIVHQKEYESLPPTQIVPILADKGIYIASESSYYRVLREAKELKHRGLSKKSVKRTITSHKATAPNQVWMWDITYLNGPIKGVHYYLYLISDLFSRKIVGWEVWEKESGKYASDLIRRTTLHEKTMLKKDVLVLHSDNGSPMKAATMLETLYSLGIIPSNSRPRVSNDNPYAESVFKTLKYRPNYQPKGFDSLIKARVWVQKFVNWYNNEHKHSGINFLSPTDRHNGLDEKIFKNRSTVYKLARQKHPERWSKGIRNWSLENEVYLNPERVDNQVIDDSTENKVS